MTRQQFASEHKRLKNDYVKKAQALAKKYHRERVPFRINKVYESPGKPKKGLTNRFVVFGISTQHYMDIGMFNTRAGVWWLDSENKCAKWDTLHGVDNPNNNKLYVKSKNQTFIKPEEPNQE